MATQGQQYAPHSHTRLVLAGIIFLFLTCGAAIWILNIEDIIQGPWSTIVAAIFTLLGVIFTFFQWLLPLSPMEQGISQINQTNISLTHESLVNITFEHAVDIVPQEGDHTGTLIVYTKKELRGESVNLCKGLLLPSFHSASNIVKRTLNGHTMFVAIFSHLEPDAYVIYDSLYKRSARITVFAGQIAEVDWQ